MKHSKSALAGAIAVRIGACNRGSCGYSSASNRLDDVPHGLSRNFRGCSRRFHGCSRRNRGFADGTIRLKNRGRGSWSDAITHDGWPVYLGTARKTHARWGLKSRRRPRSVGYRVDYRHVRPRHRGLSSQIESPRGGRVGYHVGLIVQRLTGRGFSSRSRERRSRLSGLSHRFEPKSRAAVGYHLDKRRSKPHIAARTTAWANRKQSFLKRGLSHRPLSRRRRGRIEPNVSPVPV